jgi:hypothetical protein
MATLNQSERRAIAALYADLRRSCEWKSLRAISDTLQIMGYYVRGASMWDTDDAPWHVEKSTIHAQRAKPTAVHPW